MKDQLHMGRVVNLEPTEPRPDVPLPRQARPGLGPTLKHLWGVYHEKASDGTITLMVSEKGDMMDLVDVQYWVNAGWSIVSVCKGEIGRQVFVTLQHEDLR